MLPVANLVTNIGFGVKATHTVDSSSPLAFMKAHELSFPLKHPEMIYRNIIADAKTHRDDCPLSTEKMEDIAKRMLDFAVQRLQSGATSSDIERDLIQQGVQTEVAQLIVSQALVHKP